MANDRDVAIESVENDEYLLKCKCPTCKTLMCRGYGEQTKVCPKCGQKVHISAFSEKTIEKSLFSMIFL